MKIQRKHTGTVRLIYATVVYVRYYIRNEISEVLIVCVHISMHKLATLLKAYIYILF